MAEQARVTPSQIALAWLLHRSPSLIPIPGTGSSTHLRENLAAAKVVLGDAAMEALRSPNADAST